MYHIDGEFRSRQIALFVSANILALAKEKEQKQETKKQACETLSIICSCTYYYIYYC